ncbi:MAG: PD40 domain-containing protein [Anaerolineae bacterium]|nr:PD40 domain-containing protein [Anaerolineae bacterium]
MPRSITGYLLRLTLLLTAISGGLALLVLGITRGASSSGLVFSQFEQGRGQYFVYLDPYRTLTVSRYAAIHGTEAANALREVASRSPDGSRSVIPRVTEDGVDLFIAGMDGGLTRLTQRSDFASDMPGVAEMRSNTYPLWSPDGQWISFVSTFPEQEGVDLYLVSAEGTALRRIYANVVTPTPLSLRWIAAPGEPFSPWLALSALAGGAVLARLLRAKARRAA